MERNRTVVSSGQQDGEVNPFGCGLQSAYHLDRCHLDTQNKKYARTVLEEPYGLLGVGHEKKHSVIGCCKMSHLLIGWNTLAKPLVKVK